MEKSLPWVSKSHFITFYHLSQTSGTHPNLCLTPNSAFPFPAVRAAPTGSLRERSTFSFHPLLEDKHQSHLAAHPYSWAAYKYLIAASLQLFSREEQRKEPRTHTSLQTNIMPASCMRVHTHTHTSALKFVLYCPFFCTRACTQWTEARYRCYISQRFCLPGNSDSIGSLRCYRSPLFSFSVFN